jgi:hypothetical protein
MGRLLPQALYSNSRGVMRRNSTPGPCDITDYDGVWKRAAERIDVIDPDGREAYAVLRHLQLEAARTSGR